LSILFEDRLKRLIPAAIYYPYKIAKESRKREPELAVLRTIVPGRGTAIDVGANRGIYSYALARIADRVEAFEPNPFLAALLRRKLAPRVQVHQLALRILKAPRNSASRRMSVESISISWVI
jgi:hypothetical protein